MERALSVLRIFVFIASVLLVSGCVRVTAAWTQLTPKNIATEPELVIPDQSQDHWEGYQKNDIKDALQKEVYGILPATSSTRITDHEIVDAMAFDGLGSFEEFTFDVDLTFTNQEETTGSSTAENITLAVLTPNGMERPAPVIMMQTFCPRWDVIPHPDASKPEQARSSGGGMGESVATYVFGRYICTPPITDILEQGYAIAVTYPGEFVPDRSEEGLAALERLSNTARNEPTRWGAIAAWGVLFANMTDVLEEDPRFDQNAFIAMGHSRYAKSALVAAAFDERIDAVIAHQSGTGGASLNRQKVGESVKAITGTYPHWFAPAYASFAGKEKEMSIDQHHLLALIAPRPLFLGNARRDVWSDPNGAFRAAIGANPAYELYGSDGLNQSRLDEFHSEHDVAFWIRPGTHGVVEEDWPAFLRFLDSHFSRANVN